MGPCSKAPVALCGTASPQNGGLARSPSTANFYRFFFWGEGSPTKIDVLKKEAVPTYSNLSNLEALVGIRELLPRLSR